MSTREDLRNTIRRVLANSSEWPDETLDGWIGEAVDLYSSYFPRQLQAAIACQAGQRVYSLAHLERLQAVLGVEYPHGLLPPRFLDRRDENHRFFGRCCYTVRGAPPAELVLGIAPSAGETANLSYLAGHPIPGDDITPLTVPTEHLRLLRLYVFVLAARQRVAKEMPFPDSTRLDRLQSAVVEVEAIYRRCLDDLLATRAPGGYAVGWKMPVEDRVY